MFYKNQAGEFFVVPVLKEAKEDNKQVEIAHLQKYGAEDTLCGKSSTSPIGFLHSLLSDFQPCLECARVANEMELEPYGEYAKPIYDLDFITEFASEPFNPRRAHRHILQKTQPMPRSKVRFTLDRTFSQEEYERIRLGFIPEEMEHKWLIYLERDRVYFHRSWTGICWYQLRLEKVGNTYKVAEAWVNRDPKQDAGTGDDDYDKFILEYLINRLLLNWDVPFFVPANLPDGVKHALYFHKIIGEVYREEPIGHSHLKTSEEIDEAYKQIIEEQAKWKKRVWPVEARLSLPDFVTPIVPPMTHTDKTDLLIGYQSSSNLYDIREHNENSHAIVHYQSLTHGQPMASLAVVAYGFGLESLDGKMVSEIAVNAIVERFDQSDSTNVKTLFIEGFETAAQRIAQYNADKELCSRAVATCAAVFIMDRQLYLASLGHCRVFLLRRGKVKQISVPHTVLEEWIELGHIKPDEVPIRWFGPLLLNSLDEEDAYPDFRLRLSPRETKEQSVANQGLKLQVGDQVLLCSAGLYGSGYLTSGRSKEIAEKLPKYDHPQEAVDEFILSELQQDNRSDLTMILLKVPNGGTGRKGLYACILRRLGFSL